MNQPSRASCRYVKVPSPLLLSTPSRPAPWVRECLQRSKNGREVLCAVANDPLRDLGGKPLRRFELVARPVRLVELLVRKVSEGLGMTAGPSGPSVGSVISADNLLESLGEHRESRDGQFDDTFGVISAP